MNELINEIAERVFNLVDVKSLATYGRIVVEHNGNGAAVTTSEDTFYIERELLEDDLYFLRKIFYTIADEACSLSKHDSYHLYIGAEPNGDKEIGEVIKLVGEDVISKLRLNGYSIVKDLD